MDFGLLHVLKPLQYLDNPDNPLKGYSIWMYMGGGGGVDRSPIKQSWGEGVKMKKLGVYM